VLQFYQHTTPPNYPALRDVPEDRSYGATVLVQPFVSDRRVSAIVQFPGGYVAEIHSVGQ
jgi:hypothetical protein